MRYLSLICSILVGILCTVGSYRFNSRNPTKGISTRLYAGGQVPLVPYYPNKASKDYQWMDIYNALGRERTLFVSRYLDDEACNQLIASLIWLQGQNSKDPITMYFNIPGCQVKPSMAVFDVMRRMTCPLITINTGLTRFAFPNSRFLMSRTGLDDGIEGQAVQIQMQVQEAAAYGLIDKVLLPNQPIKMMRYRGEDDDVVGFGHFSEVRRVKSGPADVIVPIKA
eukprot:gene24642-32091_t